ncbi:MAG TPA: LytTR family DNA-binding domain-containing protein [Allosphingosinicella sp.]|nr:LytTR family DNA-binding domain-containing protein [Allosphingosinicella sp.]
MRLVLLLLASWLLTGAAPVGHGPLQRCPALHSAAGCDTPSRWRLPLEGPETILRREIVVDTAALQGRPPLTVSLIALASSEVRWNGVVIGRNGVVGRDRASEVPGLYVAAFIIPPRLIRPGVNILEARLSGHHLWAPVTMPIHDFHVGFYGSPSLPGIGYYLPALLTLGALLAGLVYFFAAFLSDRADRGALAVALAAGSGAAQLLVEVSRAFIAYTYPWHLTRVGAIAVLSALTACLIASYAARRFAPRWTRRMAISTALLSIASILLVPGFDLKAMGAIAVAWLWLGIAALMGWRTARKPAAVALALAVAALALMVWSFTDYLDRTHYLLLAGIVILLVAEQVIALRRARAERDEQARLAAALAERLRKAEESGEPILPLRDGSRIHRVAVGDIVAVRAADDYCDVILTGGRDMLVTQTLTKLLDTLPPRFMRVHKSHAVNRAHVTGAAPRPGGGTLLTMSDGSEIPVGRTYLKAVADWLS